MAKTNREMRLVLKEGKGRKRISQVSGDVAGYSSLEVRKMIRKIEWRARVPIVEGLRWESKLLFLSGLPVLIVTWRDIRPIPVLTPSVLLPALKIMWCQKHKSKRPPPPAPNFPPKNRDKNNLQEFTHIFQQQRVSYYKCGSCSPWQEKKESNAQWCTVEIFPYSKINSESLPPFPLLCSNPSILNWNTLLMMMMAVLFCLLEWTKGKIADREKFSGKPRCRGIHWSIRKTNLGKRKWRE